MTARWIAPYERTEQKEDPPVFHITDPCDFLLGMACALLLGGFVTRRDRRPRVACAAKWVLIAGLALLIIAVYMGAPTFVAGWRAGSHR